MRRARALPALLVGLLLGACASAPPPKPPLPARDEQVLRQVLTEWRASGRLGVKSLDTGFSAGFDWHESAGASTIDVRGPLGLGAVHITRNADLIVIDNGRGPAQRGAAPFVELEDALAARLGAPLPLAPLRYWLLGVPDPDGAVVRDADNRFEQYGWTVTATDPRVVAGAPFVLPRQLTLERPPTRIRVVVDDWRVDPALAGAPAGQP